MKHSFIAAVALMGLIATSCNGGKEAAGDQTPVVDLNANASAETSPAIKVADFSCAQLASDTTAAFFKKATILDVVGDTVVILENDFEESRLILFSLSDGRYLGQVSHRGQGPGEYNLIAGAFVDANDGTVLLPNLNTPAVYKYALANDSLVATIEREAVMTQSFPVGGTSTCINVAIQKPDGLTIAQYDAAYQRVDSVMIPGFCGSNFSLFGNAGVKGIIMDADTLYTLAPGALQPVAILSRGDHALTYEAEGELMMKVMEGADDKELLKPYMLVRDVQFTDGKMLVTSMFDGVKHSDLYNLADGSLVYRSTYDQLSKPSCITVETADGKTVEVESLFAKDGKWYGLLGEDAEGADVNANSSIISFTF